MQVKLHDPEDLTRLHQESNRQGDAKPRNRYRDHGLGAVVPKQQTGRPPNLPATKEAAFKERFLAEPTEADGVCTFRAKDAQRILQEEFGVQYTLAGVYDLLHRLGLSCLAPPPATSQE